MMMMVARITSNHFAATDHYVDRPSLTSKTRRRITPLNRGKIIKKRRGYDRRVAKRCVISPHSGGGPYELSVQTHWAVM